MTSILALDASKYVGWALFAGPADKPQCRTWVEPGLWNSDNYGPYFVAFEKWLVDMLTVFKPGVLAWESPIVVPRGGDWGEGRGSDENNMRRLIGIVSVAELVGERMGFECWEVHNKTSKSHVGLGARKDKDGMIVAMTSRGYDVADSHQADAAAVALVVYDQLGEL